jgi:hypothetical protein
MVRQAESVTELLERQRVEGFFAGDGDVAIYH